MRKRAELEAQTRLRITESAVALHGSVGPARTSMSAVAEHAGVPRSTVYRHFPDEDALFDACSSHWRAANPAPDLGAWAAIEDRGRRLEVALTELYAHYGRTEQMLDNLIRDESTVAAVGRTFAAFHGYLGAAREVLVQGTKARGAARERVRAATGHAVAFTTWRSLTREQGLDDARAADLMCRLVAVAESGRPRS